MLNPSHPRKASADACTAPTKTFNAADIDRLMAEAFSVPRDPRSPQYHAGVRAILERKLIGTPLPALPYLLGSARADAYFAGQNEGLAIARCELDAAKATGGAA